MTYYRVEYRNNQLHINQNPSKPWGGAKSTLKNIESILRKENLSESDINRLDAIALTIKSGYNRKNQDRKSLKELTKRVNDLATSIHTLALPIPELPADPLTLIAAQLGYKDFGHLLQTSKVMNFAVKSDFCRRAKNLGWNGVGGEAEAEKYYQTLRNLLRREGKSQIPMEKGREAKDWLCRLLYELHPLKNKEEAKVLFCFISHYIRTKAGQLRDRPYENFLLQVTSEIKYDDELTLLYYQAVALMKQPMPKLIPVTKVETARAILALFPEQNFKGLLSEAFRKRDLVWIEALLATNVNPNHGFVWNAGRPPPLKYFVVNRFSPDIVRLLIKNKQLDLRDRDVIWHLINNFSGLTEEVFVEMENRQCDCAQILNTPRERSTYLRRAIKNGCSLYVIAALVAMGAELNPQDQKSSPLEAARKYKQSDIEVWLKWKGAQ